MQWESFDLSKAVIQPVGFDQGQPDPARGFTITFFTSRGPVEKGQRETFAPHKFEVSTVQGLQALAYQDLEKRLVKLEENDAEHRTVSKTKAGAKAKPAKRKVA